jgi:hypothetical protein
MDIKDAHPKKANDSFMIVVILHWVVTKLPIFKKRISCYIGNKAEMGIWIFGYDFAI